MTTTHAAPGERLTYTVAEAALALGIGRSLAYALTATGDLPTLRLGRRLLVPRAAVTRLLESSPDLTWGTVSAARSSAGIA